MKEIGILEELTRTDPDDRQMDYKCRSLKLFSRLLMSLFFSCSGLCALRSTEVLFLPYFFISCSFFYCDFLFYQTDQCLPSSLSSFRKHCVRLVSTFEHRAHTCIVFPSAAMNLRETLKKFGKVCEKDLMKPYQKLCLLLRDTEFSVFLFSCFKF